MKLDFWPLRHGLEFLRWVISVEAFSYDPPLAISQEFH